MTPVPPDSALLAAGIDYLETQLLPALTGEHRFKTRLLVNALKTVTRHQAVIAPGSPGESDEDAFRLAMAIRNNEVALDDPALLAQLEAMLRLDLQINNPKWPNSPPVGAQNEPSANANANLENN